MDSLFISALPLCNPRVFGDCQRRGAGGVARNTIARKTRGVFGALSFGDCALPVRRGNSAGRKP